MKELVAMMANVYRKFGSVMARRIVMMDLMRIAVNILEI